MTALASCSRIIPRRLAEHLDQVPVPSWVADCCSLPRDSTFRAIAGVPLPTDSAARAAVQFFVAETIRRNIATVVGLRIAPDWRISLVPQSVLATLSIRTRTPVRRLLDARGPGSVCDLTYGDLFSFRGLGVKGAIAFGLAIEDYASSAGATEAGRTMDKNDLPDAAQLSDRLRRLSGEEWTSLVYGSDPRWRALLPVSSASLSETLEQIAEACQPARTGRAHQVSMPFLYPVEVSDPREVQRWLDAVERQYEQINSLSLEGLLADLFAKCTLASGTRRDAIMMRLGWKGTPPVTLEEAGQSIGVTRERIRQLEVKTRKSLPSAPLLLPALEKALSVLADAAPLQVEAAVQLLMQRGLTKIRFDPQSVIAAATDLGLQPQICLTETKGLMFVTSTEGSSSVARILTVARRKSGASGAVSCADVAALISRDFKAECSADEVARVLAASPSFRQILSGWFWATDIAPGRSRLVNLCRKMLSVTSPISVDRLRDGMKRVFRFRNISSPTQFELRVPPRAVLEELLKAHPDFSMNGDGRVSCVTPLDYRVELGEGDRVLVDVIRSSPSGVLDRATILSECVKRGLNQQTVNVDLTYSCIIEHVDTNIWTLRGSDINPAAVEALRAANALRPRERRVMDFGWTRSGCLWIGAVVPPAVQSFVVGCPAGGRPFVAGQKFSAQMHDGTPCGTIGVTDDGTIYGLAPFSQIAGADPGDILVLEFDLTTQVVTLLLGDDELLDSYGSG